MAYLYVMGDVDRVREQIERYLLTDELANVSAFSRALTDAIADLVRNAEALVGAVTIMAGGDDVFFRIPDTCYTREKLATLSDQFCIASGRTISFGVGVTVQASYLNLRRAKSLGGGRIIDTESVVR